MRIRLLLFVALCPLIFIPQASKGASQCVIRSSQDILRCALENHPDILHAQAVKKRDEALVQVARQRPNPELDSKIVTGNTPDGQALNTETTLFHTLELGKKRRSRIKQSKAQEKVSEAFLLQTKENSALQTVLTAHRLRQIRTMTQLARNSQKAINRVLINYKQRSVLSPEQQISVQLFKAAKQEMSFKEASLLQEESSLKTFLQTATSAPISQIERHLPSAKHKWPVLTTDSFIGESSPIYDALAELELAKANKELARSETWPDLSMGPTFETQREARDTSLLVGMSLQMPLPLLNSNRGKKTFARLDEQQAHIHLATVRNKTAQERAKQIQNYQSALKTLNLYKTNTQSQKSHQDMEDLFTRGLLPLSLMIEAKRQNLELIDMKHSQELIALEALWKILIIDGHLMEAQL